MTDLAERLAPLVEVDPVLGALAEVLGAPKQQVDDVARDTDDQVGWARALDPQTTPPAWLPWLAQLPGVVLPPDAAEDEQRNLIEQAAGLRHGRSQTLVEDVQRTLTGTKTVRLLERPGGDQWAMTLITRTTETPDPAWTLRAALRQKGQGIVLTHVVSDAPLIDEGTLTIDSVGVAIDTATLDDVT